MIIRESSDFDESSADSELSDWQRDDMSFAKQMTQSGEKIDKRLIDLYQLSKAH